MKKAFITGITGQDGANLSKYLLSQGYEVHGIMRRASVSEAQDSRIAHLDSEVRTYYGDLTDVGVLEKLLREVQPDEIYNLAAMSHVRVSADVPSYTLQTNGLGLLNMLEAYRNNCPRAKFYQASSSEMFGLSVDGDNYQRETTVMNPVSIYGCSKVLGYNLVRHYRRAYGLHACNGILFNHCGEHRSSAFVEMKIAKAAVRIKAGLQDRLELGNLDAYRDFGNSKDYCFPSGTKILVKNKEDAYHKIGSQNIEDINIGDYVLSYNESTGKKEFDKVVNSLKRNTDKLIKIYLSNGNTVTVTENHPFAVLKDNKIEWIASDELSIDDKLMQYRHTSVTSRITCLKHQGKTNIEKYGADQAKEIKEKSSKVRKGVTLDQRHDRTTTAEIKLRYSEATKKRWVEDSEYRNNMTKRWAAENNPNYTNGNTLKEWFCLDCGVKLAKLVVYYKGEEARCQKCTGKFLWQNQDYRDRVIANSRKAGKNSPNKLEKRFDKFLENKFPDEFEFVGDGKIVINGFNPDFINKKGKKKIIELYGDYWHNTDHQKELHNKRVKSYAEQGFETLVLWESELKNMEDSYQKVQSFIFNPESEIVTVVKKEEINISVPVYNIETENNHNYFAYGILVHNCRAMHMILNHDVADDFVVATGETYSIRDICKFIFGQLGMEYERFVTINPKYFRPEELPYLRGDSTKIRTVLGWKPEYTFENTMVEMIKHWEGIYK